MIALWTLLACGPSPEPQLCDPVDGPLLVASSTAREFTSGAVSTLDPISEELVDPAAPAGGDPVVRALDDGRIALIERGGGDHLRLYTPGCWAAPDLEVGLSDGNPHDVLLHDGELWIAPYDRAALWVLDPSDGHTIAEVDLADYADDDGLPEPHALVRHDGRLFAALQRLDRAGGSVWGDAGGLVIELDTAAREVVASHEVGPSPRIYPGSEGIVVVTGLHERPDGAVATLDPDSGELRVHLREDDLGFDVHALAEVDGVLVVGGVDLDDEGSRLVCVDRSGGVTEGPSMPGWVTDAVAGSDGRVWLAVRSLWSAPGTGAGLVPVDPASCATGEPVGLLLEPYALTSRP